MLGSSIDPQDRKSLFIYEFYKLALDALYGDWDVTLKSDAASVDQSIQDGDLFTATAFAFFLGVLATEQGRFPEALEKIRKLEAIGETYENNYAKTLQTVLRTKYLLKTRNTRAAVSEAEGGGPLLHKAGQKFWALHLTGLKVSAHLLQGDLSEADKSLGTAESIISQEKRISPIYVSSCRVSRCLRDLRAFEDSLRFRTESRIQTDPRPGAAKLAGPIEKRAAMRPCPDRGLQAGRRL